MGVKDLWQLLSPIGRRVSIETLDGKILAIDASIWITQFIKAMRDDEGVILKNAHLIGTIRRILKLLHNRIKPVFVFDGATPTLKLRTTRARKVIRDRQEGDLKKAAERILVSQIKQYIIQQKLNKDNEGQKNVGILHSKYADNFQPLSSRSELFMAPNMKLTTLDQCITVVQLEEDKANVNVLDISLHENISAASSLSTKNSFNSKISPSKSDINELKTSPDKISLEKIVGRQVRVMFDNGNIQNGLVVEYIPPSASTKSNLRSMKKGSVQILFENGETDEFLYPNDSIEVMDCVTASHRSTEQKSANSNSNNNNTGACSGTTNASLFGISINDEIDWEDGYSALKSNKRKTLSDENDSNVSGSDDDVFQYALPDNDEELDVSALASLPSHMRKEVVEEARRRERQRKRQKYMPVAADAQLFSQTQLANFLRTSKLNKRIDAVQRQVDDNTGGRRIAAEGSRKFVMTSGHSEEVPVGSRTVVGIGDNAGSSSVLTSVFSNASVGRHSKRIVIDEDDLAWAKESSDEPVLSPITQSTGGGGGLFDTVGLEDPKRVISKVVSESHVARSQNTSIRSVPPPPPAADDTTTPTSNPVTANSFEITVKQSHQTRCRAVDTDGYWACLNCTLINKDSFRDCNACTLPRPQDATTAGTRSTLIDLSNASACDVVEEMDEITDDIAWESDCEGNWETEGDVQTANDDLCDTNPTSISPRDALSSQAMLVDESPGASIAPIGPCVSLSDDATSAALERAVTNAGKLADWAGRAVQKAVREHMKQRSTPTAQTTHSSVTVSFSTGNLTSSTSNYNDSCAVNEGVTIARRGMTHVAPTTSSLSKDHTSVTEPQSAVLVSDSDRKYEVSDVMVVSNSTSDSSAVDNTATETAIMVAADSSSAMYTNTVDEGRTEPNLQGMLEDAMSEQNSALAARHRALRDSAVMTEDMGAEVRELLEAFGLPYIVAPFEAEAQCAILEQLGVVDGVVTEDSDVFLFGAKTIYRNIFDDKKFVEVYLAEDAKLELGLSRTDLVSLAYLLGSDYTEGVRGVGVVNAMEIIHTFSSQQDEQAKGGKEADDSVSAALLGLRQFKSWLEGFDLSQALGKRGKDKGKGKYRKKTLTDKKKEKTGKRKRGAKMSQRNDVSEERDCSVSEEENDNVSDEEVEEPDEYSSEDDSNEVGAVEDDPSALVASGDAEYQKRVAEFQDKHCAARSRWTLPPGFPDPSVARAYLDPATSRNDQAFSWDVDIRSTESSNSAGSEPCQRLLEIRSFCTSRLGWTSEEIERQVLPVLKEFSQSQSTQRKIDSYFTTYHDNARFAKIQSKRLRSAVIGITNSK